MLHNPYLTEIIMETYYMYAGYSDNPSDNRSRAWKVYEDTPDNRQQALDAGYTAFSTMSFSSPLEDGKDEPNRRGDLVIDFDCKYNPYDSILFARRFLDKLRLYYGLELNALRYYLSGGKGCHVVIPAECYGGEAGDPYLPLIHERMIFFMGKRVLKASGLIEKCIDKQMYCMGKGKLLRVENIKRSDGKYKVPITPDEFFNITAEEFNELPLSPRTIDTQPDLSNAYAKYLNALYCLCRELIRNVKDRKFYLTKLDELFSCDFILHCYTHPEEITEPQWWALIRNLRLFEDIGKRLIHDFSCGYPNYSEDETNTKISNSQGSPITCEYIINKAGFDCPSYKNGSCTAGCPAHKWKGAMQRMDETQSKFSSEEDGLYYREGDDRKTKICSCLKVKAKVRNPGGSGWGRLIEIKKPDGSTEEFYLSMADIMGKGAETLKSILLDKGLELEIGRAVVTRLQEYLQGSPTLPQGIVVQQPGWITDKSYMLPDKQLGQTDDKVFFSGSVLDIHGCAGTLEEWQKEVGRLCKGNPILVFVTSYAFTPPLLKLLKMEGGGVHLYGASSQGKTSIAVVAGSIWGGDGNRGYLHQWRATDNAIEAIAAAHNDGLLVLDEIGQATSETISNTAYMLTNGQGRKRMKSDASIRKTYTWLTNFLSTGEVTIDDKIEEDKRQVARAGQSIRVLDIPLDAGKGLDQFPNLHDFETSREFIDTLRENACEYYGSPIRAFMDKLCGDVQGISVQLEARMKSYVSEWCPKDAGSQVQRAAKRFALIGAVGELAIEWNILPYCKDHAAKAAKTWFHVWIESRDGTENREIQKTIRAIKDFLDTCKEKESYEGHELFGTVNNRLMHVGWVCDGGDSYLIIPKIFMDLIQGVNKKAIVKLFIERGWMKPFKLSQSSDTKSIGGTNKRGFLIYPKMI